MERSGLTAALVIAESSKDPDLAAFVGPVHLGACFLLAPLSSPPRIGFLTPMERGEAEATGLEPLTPAQLGVEELRRHRGTEAERWASILERAFEIAGLETGRVGLAGRYPAGTVHAACSRLEAAGWSFEPAHAVLLELRKTKTAAEIVEVRRSADGLTKAMRAVASLLARARATPAGLTLDGVELTAGHLRRRITRTLARHGLEQPQGNIIAQGVDAGVPHTQGSSAVRLRAGVPIVVDLFPRGALFADCTRTFCVGRPAPELERAHQATLDALIEAQGSARDGASGADLQAATCRRLERAGYATPVSSPGTTTGYVHGLGHGVGWELHEYPSFRGEAGVEGRLSSGDVFTLEPGLYDESRGYGVRLEDLCHLGEDGLELLTPLPYDLDPTTWG